MKRTNHNKLHHRWVRRCALSWFTMLMIASIPAHAIADGAAASEYAVKAAIIFKIAKFVSWPEHAFSAQDSSLSVCVHRNDPIAAEMSALSGRSVHGRNLSVRHLDDSFVTSDICQIIFLSEGTTDRQLSLLDTLAGQPVLTIGDTDQFTSRGGIIALQIERNRVQFAINIAASESAGLDISAQLLQLAKITDNRPET